MQWDLSDHIVFESFLMRMPETNISSSCARARVFVCVYALYPLYRTVYKMKLASFVVGSYKTSFELSGKLSACTDRHEENIENEQGHGHW